VESSASTGTIVDLKMSGRLYYEDEGSLLALALSPYYMLGFSPNHKLLLRITSPSSESE
jgi:hypothetical protein